LIQIEKEVKEIKSIEVFVGKGKESVREGGEYGKT